MLRTTDWLEIEGKIKTEMLSPNTTYGAYMVLKISGRAYGLDSETAEVSVEVGDQISSIGKAYLGQRESSSKQKSSSSMTKIMVTSKGEDDERIPCEREDGWVEIELGEFFNGENCKDEVVKMSLKEVKGYQLKGGIIVEGIEVRPKLIK